MADSKIEWTGRSDWNPIRGCTRISPGCGGPGPHGGCYAEAIAARFSDPGQPFHGFAERTAKGPRWTGKVEVMWDRLTLPLRWRQPATIFASSTSDFFHEALPMESIAQLFGVMIAAHHLRGHTFQVLTKRADLMRKTLTYEAFWDIANAEASMHVMERVDPLNRRSDDARATLDDYSPNNPPPGIWLGVSTEDQQRADERIPDLLNTPAAVRFISAEPLLGPVDLTRIHEVSEDGLTQSWESCLNGKHFSEWGGPDGNGGDVDGHARLDWVIAGGESGNGARPMHPDWARSLRDQCAAAGVPFFFKQWGEWVPNEMIADVDSDASLRCVAGGKALDRVHVFPDLRQAARIGKKAAGRLLDGVEHNGFPAAPAQEG